MKYRDKKTGEIINAEQFARNSIIANAPIFIISIQNDLWVVIHMKPGDWVVNYHNKTYVVRDNSFDELYETVV